jgi:predicted ATPase with chaperone activity
MPVRDERNKARKFRSKSLTLDFPAKVAFYRPLQIQRYRAKVPAPLLDRIEIRVEVPTFRIRNWRAKMPVNSPP